MSYLKTIGWAIKVTFKLWKGVLFHMAYIFKPTDMLVKAQVTMFLIGLHTTIDDVPPMYNLREAVIIALGVHGIDLEEEEETDKE